MDRSQGVFEEKLSAFVELLNLDNRSINILRRAGIQTVSQVILTEKNKLQSTKGVGPVFAERIFSAVAQFLQIPIDQLELEEIKELARKNQVDKPLNPLDYSIDKLDLPLRTISLLKKEGIYKINQLIDNNSENLKKFIGLALREKKMIERALGSYIDSHSGYLDWKEGSSEGYLTKRIIITEESILSSSSLFRELNLALLSLGLSERSKLVLELRATRLLTLEEIAAEIGGVTRERVRQIIDQIVERIRVRFRSFLLFFDYFETHAQRLRKNLDISNLTIPVLARELKLHLLDTDLVATERDLELLIAIVRLLVFSKKEWTHDNFGALRKNFTFLVCIVYPPIEKPKMVQKYIERAKERNKKESYKDIAYMVLAKAKKSLHWKDIAERAYHLNKRERFDTRGIYNALLRNEALFVRVGQGTYELAEWGNKQVETYIDIIASVIEEERRTLPLDVIFAKVSSVRAIKQASLIMYLDMHHRFYKSINGMYGLRGWLPPREKQNLRTPEWLIEDSKSYERLERAKQRGYDVDALKIADKLKKE